MGYLGMHLIFKVAQELLSSRVRKQAGVAWLLGMYEVIGFENVRISISEITWSSRSGVLRCFPGSVNRGFA